MSTSFGNIRPAAGRLPARPHGTARHAVLAGIGLQSHLPAGMVRPDRPCHAGGCLRSAATQTILYLKFSAGCRDTSHVVQMRAGRAMRQSSCGGYAATQTRLFVQRGRNPCAMHLPADMARPATGRAVTAGACAAQWVEAMPRHNPVGTDIRLCRWPLARQRKKWHAVRGPLCLARRCGIKNTKFNKPRGVNFIPGVY